MKIANLETKVFTCGLGLGLSFTQPRFDLGGKACVLPIHWPIHFATLGRHHGSKMQGFQSVLKDLNGVLFVVAFFCQKIHTTLQEHRLAIVNELNKSCSSQLLDIS